ncbi:hypothetical protein T492DRAFT_1036048, partial [Pavlovales sp. CCMP2436]
MSSAVETKKDHQRDLLLATRPQSPSKGLEAPKADQRQGGMWGQPRQSTHRRRPRLAALHPLLNELADEAGVARQVGLRLPGDIDRRALLKPLPLDLELDLLLMRASWIMDGRNSPLALEPSWLLLGLVPGCLRLSKTTTTCCCVQGIAGNKKGECL